MAELCYPLDNVPYSAEEFQLYMSTRNSGVYANEDFPYELVSGFTLNIGRGRAWLSIAEYAGLAFANTTTKQLQFRSATSTLSRIDRVIIRFDSSINTAIIQIKEGIESSTPEAANLSRSADLFELSLYQVHIRAGSTEITAGDITDERLNENVCGLMGDSVTKINTTQIGESLAGDRARFQQVFDSWFADIKGALSEDVAGNLQNQIHNNTSKISENETDIKNLKKVVSGIKFRYVNALGEVSQTVNENIYLQIQHPVDKAWEWVDFPETLNLECRTRERVFGKIVFAKYVDLGNMPNATLKKVQFAPADYVSQTVRLEVWQKLNGKGDRVLPMTTYEQFNTYVDTSNNTINIRTIVDRTPYSAMARVWYTKVVD